MSRIIVTGGAGFIGSHLVDKLVAANHEVIVVDNLVAGKREQVNPAASFHQLDVRQTARLTELCRDVSCLFHLAALPRVPYSVAYPRETYDINVNGTLSVLRAARDANVPRVVFASSSAIYGPTETLPTAEDHPANPASPYGLHKLIGEQHCITFSRLYRLETVCLRAFNVYGPREAGDGSYATVIGKFRQQKKTGQPLLIFGDGSQTRDFIHVSDLVAAYLAAMASDRVGRGEVINICSGRSWSVNEIANLIGGPRQYQPARAGDVLRTLGDNQRAKELLGWEAQISLETGIGQLFREVSSYAAGGGLAFLLTGATFLVLTELLGLHYVIAAALAYGLGITINLPVQARLTFRTGGAVLSRRSLRFLAGQLSGLSLFTALTYALTDWLHSPQLISVFLAAAVTFYFNFNRSRRVVFR